MLLNGSILSNHLCCSIESWNDSLALDASLTGRRLSKTFWVVVNSQCGSVLGIFVIFIDLCVESVLLFTSGAPLLLRILLFGVVSFDGLCWLGLYSRDGDWSSVYGSVHWSLRKRRSSILNWLGSAGGRVCDFNLFLEREVDFHWFMIFYD